MVAPCHHNVVPKRDVGIRKAQQWGASFGFILVISRFGAVSIFCRALIAITLRPHRVQLIDLTADIAGLGLLSPLAIFLMFGALVHCVVGIGLSLVSNLCYRCGVHEPCWWELGRVGRVIKTRRLGQHGYLFKVPNGFLGVIESSCKMRTRVI